MIDEKKLINELRKYDFSFMQRKDVQDCIEAVINGQPKVGEWIPCSERLPEAMERVLVYAECTGEKSKNPNINNDVIATNWIDNHGYWVCMGVGYVVKAWMPLPEPYSGDEE